MKEIQPENKTKTKLNKGGRVLLAALAMTAASTAIAEAGCSQQPTYSQDQVSGIVEKAVNKALTDYQSKQPQPQQPTIVYTNPNVITQPSQPTYSQSYQSPEIGYAVQSPEQAAARFGSDDFTRNPANWIHLQDGGWQCRDDSYNHQNHPFNLAGVFGDASRVIYNGYNNNNYNNNNGYYDNYGWHPYNNNNWNGSSSYEQGVAAFNESGSFVGVVVRTNITTPQEALRVYNTQILPYKPSTVREGF